MTKTPIINKRRSNNLLSLFGDKNDSSYYAQPSGLSHSFYVSGPILAPEEYTEWFNTIRNAGPDDTITFHINSYGGDLYTAIQFLRVMNESQANIVASVEGMCMSAATVLFLAADAYQISAHSSFMFHNYSGGTIGKGGEMYDNILYERKWSTVLVKDIYKHFLTDEEITSILDNRDIWMDAEEVATRLDNRESLICAEIKAKEEEKLALQEVQPKTSTRKPKKV